jgi:hypothetical protein
MLQGCGGCTQQVLQTGAILLNPITWLIAISAVTAIVSKKKTGEKK